MTFKNVGILTSDRSWFIPYGKDFVSRLKEKKYHARLFFDHRMISKNYEIVFILSYFNKIEKEYLGQYKHALVVHESNLPFGKGWAPLFWQILEGKNKIPVVLFQATDDLDGGDVYIKDYIQLGGWELHDEIRAKQAKKTIELCLKFLENYENLKPLKQEGDVTSYRKRSPQDSELDIEKSIKSQFDLLRIVDNEKFPAFFKYKGKKYILKISGENDEPIAK